MNVERALAITGLAGTLDADVIGLAVQRDVEFARGVDRRAGCGQFRFRRQQGFRRQRTAGAFKQESAAKVGEHGVGQHVLI